MARYIDADALKNDGHLCWHDGKGNIYYEVDHAPTADVAEVKHGEWIGKPIAGRANIKCSVCGCVFLCQSGLWKYCPNCGAKMDGKED